MSDTRKQIDELVRSDEVVLFMKGTRQFPQCGFSAAVVQILNRFLPTYKTVNVLADPEIRQGIKDYSSWPTIPQLYVKGEFVGGCDIVKEMFASGELATKLGAPPPAPVTAPTIQLSAAAAAVLTQALADAEAGDVVHLAIDERFEHSMALGPREAGAVEVVAGGLTLLLDPASAERAKGLVIDHVGGGAGGFKIENPNAPPAVIEVGPAELKAMLDRGELGELLDVRTPDERARAVITGAKHFDDAQARRLEALDHATPIAFHCHTGRRSRSAADHFRGLGFRKVYNLTGGIDAWSRVVDPKVPRY